MKKISGNIKNKFKAISIVLFVLLIFKSCESCRRDSALQWERYNNEITVDSLNKVIDILESDILVLNDTVRKLKYQISSLDVEKRILYETNKTQSNTNKELIRTLNKKIDKDKK